MEKKLSCAHFRNVQRVIEHNFVFKMLIVPTRETSDKGQIQLVISSCYDQYSTVGYAQILPEQLLLCSYTYQADIN